MNYSWYLIQECACKRNWIGHIVDDRGSVQCCKCRIWICTERYGLNGISDDALNRMTDILCSRCSTQSSYSSQHQMSVSTQRNVTVIPYISRHDQNRLQRENQIDIIRKQTQNNIPTPGVKRKFKYEGDEYEYFTEKDTADHEIKMPIKDFLEIVRFDSFRKYYKGKTAKSKIKSIFKGEKESHGIYLLYQKLREQDPNCDKLKPHFVPFSVCDVYLFVD